MRNMHIESGRSVICWASWASIWLVVCHSAALRPYAAASLLQLISVVSETSTRVPKVAPNFANVDFRNSVHHAA